MSWDTLYKRVGTAERVVRETRPTDEGPTPPLDRLLTADEMAWMARLRERYPNTSYPTSRELLPVVTDDELEVLAGFAERVKAWQASQAAH